MPIIQSDNIAAISAILFSLAWLGFWVDINRLGKIIAGAVWVIIGAGVLSNLKVIPLQSPTYDFVAAYIVPLSIPLLLMKANLFRIFRESGQVLMIFAIAVIGTIVGVLVAYIIINLGDEGPKIAGVSAAGWIGGAMNLVAVSEAVQLPRETFATLISATSPLNVIALLALLMLPTVPLIKKYFPSEIDSNPTTVEEQDAALPKGDSKNMGPTFQAHKICGALAISFIIFSVSQVLGGMLGTPQYTILIITILTVAIVNLRPSFFENIDGNFEMGMILMYVFFAVIGASTDLTAFLASAAHIFVFGLIIVVVHLTFIMIMAKIFKFDMAEVIIASAAALTGPAATAAIATTRGWKVLVTPGIMCGVLGFVIANFIGVSVTMLLT